MLKRTLSDAAHRSARRWAAIWAGAAFVLGVSPWPAPAAGAQPSEASAANLPSPSLPTISTNGACPGRDAIATAIASLVPRDGPGALPPSAKLQVEDLGDSYRVMLLADGKERVRAYRDAGRDCGQRARFAAVFAVLTLMPPELLVETPPSAEPPPPPPAPAPPAAIVATPPPPPAAPKRFRLAAAGLFDFAPPAGDSPAIASPGAEVRLGAGAGTLGFTGGLGFEPRATFSVGALEARELRIPFDVGVSGRLRRHSVELAGEAGLAAALFNAGGTNPNVPRSGTRLDLGVRAALVLRLARPAARVAPVVGAHATYFPRPYEIETVPGGLVGHMPSVRVGATAGASIAF